MKKILIVLLAISTALIGYKVGYKRGFEYGYTFDCQSEIRALNTSYKDLKRALHVIDSVNAVVMSHNSRLLYDSIKTADYRSYILDSILNAPRVSAYNDSVYAESKKDGKLRPKMRADGSFNSLEKLLMEN